MRGYSCIGLDNPKTPANVGSVLRAAGCYGASFVAIGGDRIASGRTDTQKAWRHMPLFTGDLRMLLPEGCTPVCIEMTADAESIFTFQHPERAYYIFGPEDGSVRKEVSDWCKVRVMIPTRFCMNLACTVNVVLYDRMCKVARG